MSSSWSPRRWAKCCAIRAASRSIPPSVRRPKRLDAGFTDGSADVLADLRAHRSVLESGASIAGDARRGPSNYTPAALLLQGAPTGADAICRAPHPLLAAIRSRRCRDRRALRACACGVRLGVRAPARPVRVRRCRAFATIDPTHVWPGRRLHGYWRRCPVGIVNLAFLTCSAVLRGTTGARGPSR